MGAAKATLDGKPLAGAVSWGTTSGTRPRTAIVTVTNEVANALIGAGGTAGTGKARAVTLRLESGDPGRSGEFRDIYMLHEMPAPAPTYRALMIADRRWLWSSAYYKKAFNIRRKVGQKRLTSQNQIAAWELADDLSFAPYSLREGKTAWKPSEMLHELGKALGDWESEQAGASPKIIYPNLPDIGGGGVAIQDLELDGQLDGCIERALAYLPGLDVTVDPDGTVRFFYRTGNDESAQVARAGAEMMGRGHITPVSFSRVRPHKVRVYFSVMAEIRVDTAELASISTTSSLDPDGWWAENVLPVPDFDLAVNGDVIPTGTYITFSQALTAWNADGPLEGIGALDFSKIRRAMVPFNNLWTGAQMHGDASPDQDWMGRIGAIQSHYRRTFRLNRRIMDRLASIHPYRISTLDTESGTRGRATVYSDFAYMATNRSLFAEFNSRDSGLSYVMNCAFYPASGDLEDGPAAPATLTIEDSDQGIYSIDYHSDKTRVYEQALPSQVETEGTNTTPGNLVARGSTGPSPYLGAASRGLAWNVLGKFGQPAALTAQHKTISIFTAVPASPNSKRSLCWVDVYPNDVADFPGRGSCEGPMLETRVGPGLEVARIAWQDAQKDRIQALFTEREDKVVGQNDVYDLKDLVMNYESGNRTVASLTSIARAAAARIWHSLRDHSVGSATFGFTDDVVIEGSLSGIDHTLDLNGVLSTRMDVPAKIEAFDINRYLDASTQRIVHRIVDPRG